MNNRIDQNLLSKVVELNKKRQTQNQFSDAVNRLDKIQFTTQVPAKQPNTDLEIKLSEITKKLNEIEQKATKEKKEKPSKPKMKKSNTEALLMQMMMQGQFNTYKKKLKKAKAKINKLKNKDNESEKNGQQFAYADMYPHDINQYYANAYGQNIYNNPYYNPNYQNYYDPYANYYGYPYLFPNDQHMHHPGANPTNNHEYPHNIRTNDNNGAYVDQNRNYNEMSVSKPSTHNSKSRKTVLPSIKKSHNDTTVYKHLSAEGKKKDAIASYTKQSNPKSLPAQRRNEPIKEQKKEASQESNFSTSFLDSSDNEEALKNNDESMNSQLSSLELIKEIKESENKVKSPEPDKPQLIKKTSSSNNVIQKIPSIIISKFKTEKQTYKFKKYALAVLFPLLLKKEQKLSYQAEKIKVEQFFHDKQTIVETKWAAIFAEEFESGIFKDKVFKNSKTLKLSKINTTTLYKACSLIANSFNNIVDKIFAFENKDCSLSLSYTCLPGAVLLEDYYTIFEIDRVDTKTNNIISPTMNNKNSVMLLMFHVYVRQFLIGYIVPSYCENAIVLLACFALYHVLLKVCSNGIPVVGNRSKPLELKRKEWISDFKEEITFALDDGSDKSDSGKYLKNIKNNVLSYANPDVLSLYSKVGVSNSLSPIRNSLFTRQMLKIIQDKTKLMDLSNKLINAHKKIYDKLIVGKTLVKKDKVVSQLKLTPVSKTKL